VFLLNYSSTVTWYSVIQLLESKQKVIGVKEQTPVTSVRHGMRDLPRSFNLSQSQESRVVGSGLTNQLCTLSLTLFRCRSQPERDSDSGQKEKKSDVHIQLRIYK
jgi:hypothetical protein